VLPSDGIFQIDNLMRKGSLTHVDAVIWQWKDDRNMWHSYSPIDSKIIEVGLQNHNVCFVDSSINLTMLHFHNEIVLH
jgi:hypothetical protein